MVRVISSKARTICTSVSGKRSHESQLVTALRAQLGDQQTQLEASQKAADQARDDAASTQQQIAGLYGQQQAALANAAATEQNYNAKLATSAREAATRRRVPGDLRRDRRLDQERRQHAVVRQRPVHPSDRRRGHHQRLRLPHRPHHGRAGAPRRHRLRRVVRNADPRRRRGVVLSAGPDDGYGNATVINHGAGSPPSTVTSRRSPSRPVRPWLRAR